MAEDLEVGVMLEVDDSQLEDIEDQEVNVDGEEDGTGGGGGGLFTKGTVIIGILSAILSQLQGAQSILNGLFRILNLILTPIWQGIASAVRPLADLFMNVAQAIQKFGIRTILETAFNKFIDQLTGFINNAINSFKNALNQIPGVSMETGGQTVTQNQTQQGLETATTATQLSNPATAPAAMGEIVADRLNQLETMTADLQDEEKKETTGSFVVDLVDEVI